MSTPLVIPFQRKENHHQKLRKTNTSKIKFKNLISERKISHMSNPTHAILWKSWKYWNLNDKDKAMWNHRNSLPCPYQSPAGVFFQQFLKENWVQCCRSDIPYLRFHSFSITKTYHKLSIHRKYSDKYGSWELLRTGLMNPSSLMEVMVMLTDPQTFFKLEQK